MKWLRNRFLLLPYVVLMVVFVTVGCSSKEDPGETLATSGNHSTGDLFMVTTDTSSDGYYYLDPQLGPDGVTVLFTADWWAIPTTRDPGDATYVKNRQMIMMPLPPSDIPTEPQEDLPSQGAVLIYLQEISIPISGVDRYFTDTKNMDKGNPVWEDDTHVLFWLNTEFVGSRLFRADVSDASYAPIEVLFMEPTDAFPSPPAWQHMEGTLSPNKRWLAFTRSGCVIPDSFETCTGIAIHVLDMTTAGLNDGYDAVTIPVTNEYSRIETPEWSPDGTKIIFSGGMDVGGGYGSGTELFTVDIDTIALAARDTILDNNIHRLTSTSLTEGDPISGVFNFDPTYSNDSSTIFFTSTRRAPTTTLHDRNIWYIPADGLLEPEIYYFTRDDNVNPFVMPDGKLLFSSSLGFSTEDLTDLEEKAYQTLVVWNDTPVEDGGGGGALTEVQMQELASEEVRKLEFFEGVMSWLYTFGK